MCSDFVTFLFSVSVLVGVSTGLHQNCNCTSIDKCKSHVDLVKSLHKPISPQILQYLKERHCASVNDIPMVCCNDSIYKKPPSRTKRKTCEKRSDCIILKDCKPYLNLVKSMGKPLQPAVVEFLRSQECGFDQGYPLVCCSEQHLRNMKNENLRTPPNKPNKPSPTVPVKATTVASQVITKPAVNNNVYNKADALNKAFMSDYFDYTGSFDLMLRIKREGDNNTLDIEIR